jgi:hypothetical protein
MAVLTLTGAHQQTTKLDIHEVALRLNEHLGPTLVATLANARSRSTAHKWAKAASEGGVTPRYDSAQRLRDALTIWIHIASADNEHVARAWFVGGNPRLAGESPVMCLREGREQEVWAAAKAFVDGTDD